MSDDDRENLQKPDKLPSETMMCALILSIDGKPAGVIDSLQFHDGGREIAIGRIIVINSTSADVLLRRKPILMKVSAFNGRTEPRKLWESNNHALERAAAIVVSGSVMVCEGVVFTEIERTWSGSRPGTGVLEGCEKERRRNVLTALCSDLTDSDKVVCTPVFTMKSHDMLVDCVKEISNDLSDTATALVVRNKLPAGVDERVEIFAAMVIKTRKCGDSNNGQ